VFGRLDPGQSREWSTTLGTCETENDDDRVCTLPRDVDDRADGIRVVFEEAHDHVPEPAEIRTRVQALPRPIFAYAVQVADEQGNDDGRLQRGEHARMYVRIRNVGRGRTYETQANLRNLSGRGILLRDGRFHLDPMEPGDETEVEFTFQVLEDFDRDEAKLEVSIADTELREIVNENVIVPLADSGSSPSSRSGDVQLDDGAVVRESPEENGEIVGRATGGGLTYEAEAELDGWVRVDLGDDRPGWVQSSDLGGSGSDGQLEWHVNHMPPRLEVDHGDTLVTREPRLRVEGRATDDQHVRDLYIFVGTRKVFYQSNRGSGTPRRASFETDVPLHGGINYVTVFARESDDVVSRQTFVVRRDAEDGSLMETPEHAEDAFGFDEVHE